MRQILVVIGLVLAAGCGGEGRCDSPPCNPSPPRIDCTSNADCFQTERCDTGGVCGGPGICVARPSIADCIQSVRNDVCGCDGQLYGSHCLARVAGVEIDEAGGCARPPGEFACGPFGCDRATEVCLHLVSGDDSFDSFRCETTPACAANRTCACLQPSLGCDDCADEAGAITLTCPLPVPEA